MGGHPDSGTNVQTPVRLHVEKGTKGSTGGPRGEQRLAERNKKAEQGLRPQLTRNRGLAMGDDERESESDLQQRLREAEKQLEKYESENQKKDHELRRTYQQLEAVEAQADSYKEQVDRYASELEGVKVDFELEKHRALDSLRAEHAMQFKFLQSQAEREWERTDNWISELRERLEREKEGFMQRIRMLEGELLRYQTQSGHGDPDACFDSGPSTNSGPSMNPALHCPPVGLYGNLPRDDMCSDDDCLTQTVKGELLTSASTDPGFMLQGHMHSFTPEEGAIVIEGAHREAVSRQSAHPNSGTVPPTDVQGHMQTATAVQGQMCPPDPVQGHTNQSMTNINVQRHSSERIPVSTTNQSKMHVQLPPPLIRMRPANEAAADGSTHGQSVLVQSMAELLKAQTQMLSVQAQAASIQGLPSLPAFTGEESPMQLFDEDFDHWLKSFEERAKVAKWTNEQKLYQFKAHLKKTALQMFRLLPEDEKFSYDKAVHALKKRFKPTDIEELRGIEFNQKMQQEESIEQLGIELQNLGRKAFPRMKEEEFDRLLKGRFFQALSSRWQRKLAAPKPGETFSELYDRARTLEKQHIKQISATAALRGDNNSSKQQQGRARPSSNNQRNQRSQNNSTPANTGQVTKVVRFSDTLPGAQHRNQPSAHPRGCYVCGGPHRARECPSRGARLEAPGRTRNNPSRTAQLTSMPTTTPSVSIEQVHSPRFTEEQLVQMLSQCRLQKEEALLEAHTESQCNTIRAHSPTTESNAVGPVLLLNLQIEGLPVEAMVDTGSQSTIISRNTLHKVKDQLLRQGKEVPKLRLPSVKLYGKDCDNDRNELNITSEVTLTLEVDGRSVKAPVFVQPNSEQPCLLGMNIAPELGLKFLDTQGFPLKECPSQICQGKVQLIQASTLPGRKGRFLEAKIDPPLASGTQIVFQPATEALHSRGVSAQDSLLSVLEQGTVLIPLQNFEHNNVDLIAGLELGRAEPLEMKVAVKPGDCSLAWPGHPTDQPRSKCSKVTTRNQAKLHQDRKLKLMSQLNLSQVNLTAEQYAELEGKLLDNADVFALDGSELGYTDIVKHSIDTGDHSPIKQNPRCTPFVHRDKISQLVNDMLKQQVVQPSTSAWASPVVLVPKKDGTLRFCVDYRRINAVTKKDVYPLPRVDDILETLRKAKFFLTLDLAAGYWQIAMDPATRDKSAFTTHCGLFEFLRMPFGLCNSPATFQRLMQTILSGLERI